MKKETPSAWDQPHPDGLVLRTWQPAPITPALVACCILRVRDLPRLLEHAPSWYPAVERAVFVLGAWSEPETPKQVRATAETLRTTFPGCTVIEPPLQGWTNQIVKRSAYFKHIQLGEVAFVIDSDETVLEGPDALATAARRAFDVGWITISAPTRYDRPYGQPRLFRMSAAGLTYGQRHYWVTTLGGALVAAHRYGGTGVLHERLPLTLSNTGGRRTLRHTEQHQRESRQGSHIVDFERDKTEQLRIVQLTRYDAGLAVYRLHSAINATTRDRSLMLSDCGDNTLEGPTQYDIRDRALAKRIVEGADVVHCHLGYDGLTAAGGQRPGQTLVIHHHGTVYRTDPERWNRIDVKAQLRLASTMDLLNRDVTHTLQWLPNPVPVALYRAMRAAAMAARPGTECFRIVHSPSKPHLKGTEDLLAAFHELRKKKLPVELELIQGVPHGEALWRKAQGDIMFDSFWLGIQVSGIEAAAMGMPVVAGDADTARAYTERIGAVPYTFAEKDTLVEVLERLITDPAWREAEAARVAAYALEWHDEAAVALRYVELLHQSKTGLTTLPRQLKVQVDAERRSIAQALRGKGVVSNARPIGGHFRLGPKTRGV